jgi:transposase
MGTAAALSEHRAVHPVVAGASAGVAAAGAILWEAWRLRPRDRQAADVVMGDQASDQA